MAHRPEHRGDESKGAEGFVLDKDGNRTDASIHEPILAEGQLPDSSLDFARTLGREAGLSDEMIRRLWG